MEKFNKYVQTEAFYDNICAWRQWDKNPHTVEEIENLLAAEDYATLKELLGTRLIFEGSGIQGRMGAGFNRINELVVIQTTQGLASYLESIDSLENLKKRGIAVGFDIRHNSQRFAHLTAVTFVNRGYRVCLFADVCPLVFVPFCVKANKCVAGVMITGSSNSKYDNGYRIYWENGVHPIPPHDKNIQVYILNNLEPLENAWDTTILEKNTLVKNPLVQITGMYYNKLRLNTLYPDINNDSEITVTYTAMHGVGHRFMVEAFRAANLHPLFPVKEQMDINPEFPTMDLPNPNDEDALNKAVLTANNNWSRLILATDPDAQYLSVVERFVYKEENSTETECDESMPNCGQEKFELRLFTGNELATLLSWWSFYTHKQKNPDEDIGNIYMLGTVTSTRFLQSLALTEGFNYIETLAGFQWIVDKTQELITEEKSVLFGYSEPYDFMIGTNILEKDAILASVNLVSLANYLDIGSCSLSNKLQELYNVYGHYFNKCHSITVDDIETFENIFYRLRNFSGEPNSYPTSLAEGEYIIESVQDYTTGYNSLNDEIILSIGPAVELVKFVLNNGAVVTITDCGTRKMIKYFVEMVETALQEEDIETSSPLQDEDMETSFEKTSVEVVDTPLLDEDIETASPLQDEDMETSSPLQDEDIETSFEKTSVEVVDTPLQDQDIETSVEKTFYEIVDHVLQSVEIELLRWTVDSSELEISSSKSQLGIHSSAKESREFHISAVDVAGADSLFLQPKIDPSVPGNNEFSQPEIDSSMPEDSEFPKPEVDSSVHADLEFIQEEIGLDSSVPEDSEFNQSTVEPSEHENGGLPEPVEDSSVPVPAEDSSVPEPTEDSSVPEPTEIPQEAEDSPVPDNNETAIEV